MVHKIFQVKRNKILLRDGGSANALDDAPGERRNRCVGGGVHNSMTCLGRVCYSKIATNKAAPPGPRDLKFRFGQTAQGVLTSGRRDRVASSRRHKNRQPSCHRILSMRTTVIAALGLAVTIACGPVRAAEDGTTLTERLKEAARQAGDAFRRGADAVAQSATEAWDKTEAYLSDDPATYRQGAANTLQELGGELAQLRQESAAIAPERVYYQTLLAALEQQRQYAVQQLAALSPEAIHAGRQGARRGLDNTMRYLEGHVDLARQELRDLVGTTSR